MLNGTKSLILKWSAVTILVLLSTITCRLQTPPGELLIPPPEHGFVSRLPASKWEESMITGNGTTGALVIGDPLDERIILSHEKLFMPEYPPTEAPALHKYMDRIRELTLNGQGKEAAELAVRAGREVGIQDWVWTDPLIPACQLEIKSLSEDKISNYARSVNYESGEATTAWESGGLVLKRSLFFSRMDSIGVLKISGSGGALNFRFRLSQLPIPEHYDEEDEWQVDELISAVTHGAEHDRLFYSTTFKKQWENSLKGYWVVAKVLASGGRVDSENDWLVVRDANEIMVLMDIQLSYSHPLKPVTRIDKHTHTAYPELLNAHKRVHSKLFNRFSLRLGILGG